MIVGMLVVASVAHPVVSTGTVTISNNITAIKSSDVKRGHTQIFLNKKHTATMPTTHN